VPVELTDEMWEIGVDKIRSTIRMEVGMGGGW